MNRLAAALLLALALPLGSQADVLDAQIAQHESARAAPLLAADAFIATASVRHVVLAPNGAHAAWQTVSGSSSALHLLDTTTGAETRLAVPPRLRSLHWLAGGTHLLLDLGDSLGLVDLAAPQAASWLTQLDQERGDALLTPIQNSLDSVLVLRRPEDGSYVIEQLELDGSTRELLRQTDILTAALLAADGRLFVHSVRASEQTVSLWQSGVETTLVQCTLLETCDPSAFDDASATLWLQANNGSDLSALVGYALATGEMQLRDSDPERRVDLLATVFGQGTPLLTHYYDGLLVNQGLTPEVAAAVEQVQRLLPTANLRVGAIAANGQWLLSDDSAVQQFPRHYLYDSSTQRLQEIATADIAVAIPPAQLAQRLPLSWPASDGAQIHGYLSLPSGVELTEAPLIALIHGGPWGRLYGDYSDVTQFLVNRGYIVFEPNFRASTGYGRRYLEQAAGEFNDGLVQQDITSGVDYLLTRGIGDRTRVAIAGHSFGGFSVMNGLVFTPALFSAGFASATSADMAAAFRFQIDAEALRTMNPTMRALLTLMFGDLDDDATMTTLSAGAAARLAAIEAPLLLIAGGDDQQVPIADVKRLALELQDRGKQFTFFIDENEGHGIGLSSPRSRLAYLSLLETFMAAHLGGHQLALNDAAVAALLRNNLLIDTDTAFALSE